ncbi:MAG: alkaline phosphatase family protein [Syntrophobacteraceae bacterium]
MIRLKKAIPALAVAASLLQLPLVPAASAQQTQTVTAQPNVSSMELPYFIDPTTEPAIPQSEIISLLRQKIKYVFVIFNENESFDHEYGTFPGANGIYSDGQNPRSAANTPGFYQTYTDNATGAKVTVQPFRVGPGQNSTVSDSTDHSNAGMIAKYDVKNGLPQMDGYSQWEYQRFAGMAGTTPTAAKEEEGTQFARMVMAHVDCNTVPFFWQYASRFAIFDNIYATEDGPSTPNAIAMISGQVGQTQWVKHPGEANGQSVTVGSHSGTLNGPPITSDYEPFWGSQYDTTTGSLTGDAPYTRQPNGPNEYYGDNNIAMNLTFAALPLTFQGTNISSVLSAATDPSFAADTADIQLDMPYIQSYGSTPVNWGWFQEGYGLESTDTGGVASHISYVTHHNAVQYFGYIANTPAISKNMHGLTAFFNDTANNSLPNGGVFYIRGGYKNLAGAKPVITDPKTPQDEIATIDAAKSGDDDHPAYTDHQLSEAMAARVINAVASNPTIWSQCAIIITYDETDGLWDHVPPRILSYGPRGLLSRGSRVPLLLISPYARTHVVSHVEGDHNSVIETINYIFGLPSLASLPDEAEALQNGNSPTFNAFAPDSFQQTHLGPDDIESSISSSLLSGFDPYRLTGAAPPLPASFAMIPDYVVNSFPHYGGNGCQDIGIVPTDVAQGITNEIPNGYNPLPSTYPTTSNADARTYGGLWQNATSLGNGWDYLSPFGAFYTTTTPWIYIPSLGWVYPEGTFTDSIWFYDPQWDGNKSGWWWTNASSFPWIYSGTENQWFFFCAKDSSASGPRLFVSVR